MNITGACSNKFFFKNIPLDSQYPTFQKYAYVHAQLYLTLQPVDCSPPGSFVCGIFLARILEWVAISYSIQRCQDLNFY